MKKGDLRKKEILSTAEELFCRQGYEKTSVQDIIDRLNSSKGSFYHHFASKEALLEGICRNRAEQIFIVSSDRTDQFASAPEKLNSLLSCIFPFAKEKLSFMMMLLPVFSLPEGKLIVQYYCNALSEQFRIPLSKLLESGHQSSELFCTDPENATALLLFITNRLWTEICNKIIMHETNHTDHDLSEYLRMIQCSRTCIERFLCLPFGSVEMISLQELRFLIEQIHNHWE